MRGVLAVALFCGLSSQVYSQTAKIDSLKRLVTTANRPAGELRLLLDILALDESLPTDTIWNYAMRADAIAAALGDRRGATLALLAKSDVQLRRKNIDSAMLLIESEIKRYTVTDAADRDLYFKLARARIDCLDAAGRFEEATAHDYELIREAERYNDSLVLAECYNSLAAWDYNMDLLDASMRWSYKALATTSPTPRFYFVLANICFNLGDTYWWIGKLDSAERYIQRGMEFGRRIDNLLYWHYGLQKMAEIAVARRRFAEAERDILASIQVARRINGDEPNDGKLIVLASVYRNWGKPDKAIAVVKKALARDSAFEKVGMPGQRRAPGDMQQMVLYEQLARCYRDKGDHAHYEATLEQIIARKDTIYRRNSAAAIAELQTKYEVEKKEATIARQNLALVKDRYLMFVSLLAAGSASVIFWLVFRNYRRRQRMNLLRLQEEEKRLAAQAVATAEETERRRIAADLHDNLGAQLSFIKRSVNFILDQPDGFNEEEERKYLRHVNDTAQTAMIDLRETIWVLNRDEVDIQEFADKLKSYLRQQLQGQEAIRWNFTERIRQRWKLSSGEVMDLFRIVQELVSNVIKHANADLVFVDLEGYGPGGYRLEVSDNGRGFDVKGRYEGHYGMENIDQRARKIGARLSIISTTGSGTKVVLEKGGPGGK